MTELYLILVILGILIGLTLAFYENKYWEQECEHYKKPRERCNTCNSPCEVCEQYGPQGCPRHWAERTE